MAFGGAFAALAHSFADDEVLKNAFVNFAFENFECASYKGLLLARSGGYSPAYEPLSATLDEEVIWPAGWTTPADVGREHLELKGAKRRPAGDL